MEERDLHVRTEDGYRVVRRRLYTLAPTFHPPSQVTEAPPPRGSTPTERWRPKNGNALPELSPFEDDQPDRPRWPRAF